MREWFGKLQVLGPRLSFSSFFVILAPRCVPGYCKPVERKIFKTRSSFKTQLLHFALVIFAPGQLRATPHLNSCSSHEYLKRSRHHRKRFVDTCFESSLAAVSLLTVAVSVDDAHVSCRPCRRGQFRYSTRMYFRHKFTYTPLNMQNLVAAAAMWRPISQFNLAKAHCMRANWSRYVNQNNRVTCIRGKVH